MIKVVKIGGNIVDNPVMLREFVRDFAAMPGMKVLVHGGGVMASQMQKEMGMAPHMVEGRRVTDEETLKVVTMVYAGWCNKNIVSLLQAEGCNAIGLTGADGNAIRARKRLPVMVESLGSEVDYGFVGDVSAESVNAEFIYSLLERGIVPVFNAINHDGCGNLLNTNADTIASSVAVAMAGYKYRSPREVCCKCEECTHCSDDGRLTHQTELIYCFEKDGVLYDKDDDESVIAEIDRERFAELRAEGRVADGMIPKLENSFRAIEAGVEKVIIKHARNLGNERGTVLVREILNRVQDDVRGEAGVWEQVGEQNGGKMFPEAGKGSGWETKWGENVPREDWEEVQLLKEMIAIPSPSFGEIEVCSHISKWLKDREIEHRVEGCNIIAEHIIDPSRPTLMLCAHIDTVAPSPEYDFNPYNPDYQAAAKAISEALEKSYGPSEIVAGLGSNDDGASVVSMIAVYRHFLKKETDNPKAGESPNLILVLTCEEERSGVNGMTGLWKQLAEKVDYAIVGEPTGMRAATSERGLLVIDATAHGVSGHAARNEGENAIEIALEDISRLRSHCFERVSPIMGKVNLNVTQINAGTAHNIIPDSCDFVIDIRPTEQYSNEEILAELQSICRSELKPRNLANRSSASRQDSPLKATADALEIATFSSPTTSDWMRISCDAIKMGPGESSRSHRKNEFVLVEEIRNGIERYIEFIENLPF